MYIHTCDYVRKFPNLSTVFVELHSSVFPPLSTDGDNNQTMELITYVHEMFSAETRKAGGGRGQEEAPATTVIAEM